VATEAPARVKGCMAHAIDESRGCVGLSEFRAAAQVYGWMPTILKSAGIADAIDREDGRLVRFLNAARLAKKPGLSVEDIELISVFTNNSTVGASKLLHFLNPRVFPIWDSRVAKRYLWPKVVRNTFDQRCRYFEYLNTLWEWSSNRLLIAACAELKRECPGTASLSTIRIMELVLFHAKS